MFCPSGVNTGFVELVGPIQQQDLNSITVKSYPLSISFAPRTTIPTLLGNRIDESTENTCTYKGNRFSLVDVQICKVISKGYTLPGQKDKPAAELVLSFSANSAAQDLSGLSGILLCLPIFDSGVQNHSEYLMQLIDSSIPSCDYTNIIGGDYKGADYQQLKDSNLNKCIKTCCDDVNCLAYTFHSGTCYLKNAVPSLNKTTDNSYIAGTVKHTVQNKGTLEKPTVVKCDSDKKTKKDETKSKVPNLETLFYGWDGDTSQDSIAYKTCFEIIDKQKTPSSKSLYVVVFPHGISLSHAAYQQLLIQLGAELKTYTIPPAIRGGDATLRNYKFDDDGNKVPTLISDDGIIYSTPISSCTDDFVHRFEYFTLPPRLPTSSKFNTEQCPYYKTTEYKCMPFNQLKDLSGAYVVPGNKTLDTILYEQEQKKTLQHSGDIKSKQLTTEQIEGIIAGVAGIAIAAVIALKVGSWISNHA